MHCKNCNIVGGGARYDLLRSDANTQQPAPAAAIELIHQQPVRWIHERTVECDGGGGPLGHPRVFINLDKPEICTCTYCGLPFVCTLIPNETKQVLTIN